MARFFSNIPLDKSRGVFGSFQPQSYKLYLEAANKLGLKKNTMGSTYVVVPTSCYL